MGHLTICNASTRAAMIMIPAKTQCPSSWTREYHDSNYGYLMTEQKHPSHYQRLTVLMSILMLYLVVLQIQMVPSFSMLVPHAVIPGQLSGVLCCVHKVAKLILLSKYILDLTVSME